MATVRGLARGGNPWCQTGWRTVFGFLPWHLIFRLLICLTEPGELWLNFLSEGGTTPTGDRGTEGPYHDDVAACHFGFLGAQDEICGHHAVISLADYWVLDLVPFEPQIHHFLSSRGPCYYKMAHYKAWFPPPGRCFTHESHMIFIKHSLSLGSRVIISLGCFCIQEIWRKCMVFSTQYLLLQLPEVLSLETQGPSDYVI